VVLRIAHDGDAAAVGAHGVAFGHGVGGVVGPLAVHVGLEQTEQPVDIRIREHDHVVDALDGRHHLGALGRREDRTPGPLEAGNRRVVVDRHDQAIGLGRRSLEVADVPDVEDVEAPVGKGHGLARGAVLAHQVLQFRFSYDSAHIHPSHTPAGPRRCRHPVS
jgi:hypothetical protein